MNKLIAALLLLVSCCVSAATPPTQAAELNAAQLEQAIDAARELPRLHGVLIAHRGDVVREEVLAGPPLHQPVNIKSMSKTVISALVGIAIDKGIFEGPDQPIVELLGDRVPEDATAGVEEITVGNLLSLQAGVQRTSGPFYGQWVNSDNWVHYVLTRPFVAEPGGDFLYSTGSTHLLSAALTEASGQSTLELARQWLGNPLNIRIPEWPQDPQGIYFGGNQMLMSPRALLEFGELYRRGGRVEGEQVISSDWIETSWQPRGRSPFTGDLYGYGWYINEMRGESVYSARGFGGQMLYVIPGLEMTVVITADTDPPSPGAPFLKRLNAWLEESVLSAAD